MNDLTEWRRGRNYIRTGDLVRVRPSKPGKKDGGPARLLRIVADEAGAVSALQVLRAGAFHWFRPERIERMAQTRGGAKVEVHA